MPRRFFHETTDSTSERAFEALAAGTALDGDVHVARVQMQGRGRLGRAWASADGGLYLSVVILPASAPPATAWTVAGGLAVLDAARELGVQDARLEWPNDLLVSGAKVAGVLVETRGLDPGAPHYVLGVGLNVLQTTFPAELEAERAVTSLARLGLAADLDCAEEALVRRIRERVDAVRNGALEALGRDYLDAIGLAGHPVRVETGGKTVAGRLLAVDLERGLQLETSKGEERHVAMELVRALVV